ncbi:MAG: TetR/AcrR family transcriptional regulator [Rhodospirillales bacterium]|jgi:TetR/AcrR family transcriptional repressor of nem operon|nr:TetR/AcrR family transcriptional regulator [Rhodospirillales bacterium]
MARPREFDTIQVLEQATHLFLVKGYAATSLRHLIVAMDISKSSFYEAFDSKQDLYLLVLDRYIDKIVDQLVSTLGQGASPRTAIAVSFNDIIDGAMAGDDCLGCLLTNAAAEVCADDAAAGRIAHGLARQEEAYYEAIVRAQRSGEVPPGHDARALARFLTTSANGLQLMAKATSDRMALYDVARVVLSCLD